MFAWLDRLPLSLFLVLALTLGLAPFMPEPHIWEKLKMLAAGDLARPIDIFDLLMHGIPWLLLFAKLGRMAVATRVTESIRNNTSSPRSRKYSAMVVATNAPFSRTSAGWSEVAATTTDRDSPSLRSFWRKRKPELLFLRLRWSVLPAFSLIH